MSFFDEIKQIAAKVKKHQVNAQNEAQTISYLVYPFLKDVLGYDYGNPDEVIREFVADIPGRKGEKVDIVLLGEGEKPIMLVEVKSSVTSLGADPLAQLKRYFPHTPARVGVLTNGLIYKFFSEKSDNNKVILDSEPFLEIDLLKYANSTVIEDDAIKRLQKFRKKDFDVEEILCAAEDLKYTNAIKEFFKRQMDTPEDDFVKVILRGLPFDTNKKNKGEKFGPHVKQAFIELVSERVAKRIATAGNLEINENTDNSNSEFLNTAVNETNVLVENDNILISEEGLEAVHIVKAIIAESIDISRISYKVTTSYISIIIDNKVTKWVCRFAISSRSKFLIISSDKFDEKVKIESINEIYKYRSILLDSVSRYI